MTTPAFFLGRVFHDAAEGKRGLAFSKDRRKAPSFRRQVLLGACTGWCAARHPAKLPSSSLRSIAGSLPSAKPS